MALVGYSDSEGSDSEPSKPTPAPATTKTSSKPAFQKVVDRSNPHKIRVNLPSTESNAKSDDADGEMRPFKKPRMSGGFNAMLPAPKRSGQVGAASGETEKKRFGLGKGVHLRTGAQPAFSREPVETSGSSATSETERKYDLEGAHGKTNGQEAAAKVSQEEDVKLVGRSTIFRPLSVSNKKQKKRTATAIAASAPATPNLALTPSSPKSTLAAAATAPASALPKPKMSLFSFGDPEPAAAPSRVPGATVKEDVQYSSDRSEQAHEVTTDNAHPDADVTQSLLPRNDHPPKDSSLNSIAADLNLSAAEKRQLFGRKAKNMPAEAINVVNFNTDQEYAANEAARASGEAAAAANQNRGVRAIAPGKHSLKQLMNAATSQRDELEDSFAQGRKNKREAGNKYGWG